MEIYVSRNAERYGPYTPGQIEAYLANGSLSPSDQAWHAGLEAWQPLSDLIAPAPKAPPPPPPPPRPESGLAASTTPAEAGITSIPAMAGGASAPGRLDVHEALTFPLRDSRALGRIWWLPLAALLPFFGSVLLRGWRLDLVRRVSQGYPERLPDGKDLGCFLADGVVLLVMNLLYYLPLWLFIVVFGWSRLTAVLEVLWWAVQTFFTEGAASFWAVVAQIALRLLAELIAPIVYFTAVWPLHRMAMMRFALSKSLRVFFQVWRNFRLCLRFMPEIFLAYFVDFVAFRLLRWLARALVTVGIGVVFAPLASALYFWTTGHLFGQIAGKVADLELGKITSPDPSAV